MILANLTTERIAKMSIARKGLARALVIVIGGVVSFPAVAVESSWITLAVHEGCYTNAAIWNRGYVPTNTSQAVQINTSNLGDFKFKLTDWQTKAAYHMLMVYPGSTLTLDGIGATFDVPALTEDEGVYFTDPATFSIQTGASVPKTKLLLMGYTMDPVTGKQHVPTYREPQYRFEDVYLAITNTADNDVTMDFVQGTFDFDYGGDPYRIYQFGTGMLETNNQGEWIRSETVRFHSGATLKFPYARFNGMSCSNAVNYTVAGKILVAADLNVDGLARVLFTDGAQVSAKTIGRSYSGNRLDDAVMTIDGAATRVQASSEFFVGFKGCGTLNMRDGELTVGTYFAFGNTPPDAQQNCTLNQTGGKIEANMVVACRQANSAYLTSTLNLDGGELCAGRMYGSNTKVQGKLGTGILSANGGTYRSRGELLKEEFPFLGGFDRAELGPKGLTIWTDFQNRIYQAFTNKVGQTGRLFLKGSGTIYLAADTFQDELVSGVSSLVFDSTVMRCDANVIVTNGTSVSFADSSALTLDGLVLDGGSQLTVAATTHLTAGSVRLGAFTVALSGAFEDGTYPFVTVKGRVSAADREGWLLSGVMSGRAAGKTYNFRCSDYDATTDTTVLSLEIGPAFTPVVTDAEDVATPVADLQVLGALAFTQARDYVLGGSGKFLFEDSGAAAVSVASGIQKIGVQTYLPGVLLVDVKGGSTLVFDKPVLNGGIDKTGTGVLAFGADAASELPLGLTLRDGTWKVEAEGERTAGVLKIQSPNPSNAVVLAAAADTTVAGLTVSSGAIVKTGVGALTVENESTKMQLYGDWSIHGQLQYGVTVPSEAMDFPADDTPPTQNYSAFNVVEGEMVLRGTGADAPTSKAQYFSTAEVFIGMRSPLDVAAAPGLAIDHAQVDLGGTQRHVFIAANPVATDISGEAANPYLVISNNAEVVADGIVIGTSCDGDGLADVYPAVIVDNAALKVTCRHANSFLTLSGGKACHTSFALRNASTLETADLAVRWWGDAEVDVDGGSVLTKYDGAACAIELGKSAKGEMTVRDGSTLRCASVTLKSGEKLAFGNRVDFAFDGGYLDPAADAFVFSAVPSGAHLVALAGGLKLAVPADGTWTLPDIVEGEGAIVSCGEGTVALSDAVSPRIAGPGRFSGSMTGLRILPTLVDGAVADAPILSGAEVSGRVTVDLGHGEDDPLDIATLVDLTVAHIDGGTVPDVSQWRLAGTGHKNVRGTFVIRPDGAVVLTEAHVSGLLLIIR